MLSEVEGALILQLTPLASALFFKRPNRCLPVLFHQVVHVLVVLRCLTYGHLVPFVSSYNSLLHRDLSLPLTCLVLVNKTCVTWLTPVHRTVKGDDPRAA